MAKRVPKLSHEAAPLARSVHAFMAGRGLSMRGWCRRAGLSANVLAELFSGRTRSLKYATLERLAAAEGVAASDLAAGAGLVRVSDVAAAVSAWAAERGIADPEGVAEEVIRRLTLVPDDAWPAA
ncbi:helix-turn-helix domain-containing protein [Paramagnetospirillum magneticum]|nr:helix-turn-helix transcriptional regulator [Paramagnetospirillum magneticum]